MDEQRSHTAASRSTVPPESLSLRQQDIAALIGEGLSDAEVARELVSTREAIATLVEDIVQRLGVGSRVQIATWAAAAGLTGRHHVPGESARPAS